MNHNLISFWQSGGFVFHYHSPIRRLNLTHNLTGVPLSSVVTVCRKSWQEQEVRSCSSSVHTQRSQFTVLTDVRQVSETCVVCRHVACCI
jgi:hypothetical protein